MLYILFVWSTFMLHLWILPISTSACIGPRLMAGHLTMRMVRLFHLMAVMAVGKEWCRPISECHGKKERLERNESINLGERYYYSSQLQVAGSNCDMKSHNWLFSNMIQSIFP